MTITSKQFPCIIATENKIVCVEDYISRSLYPIVVTFFKLKICMYCHRQYFILCFLFTSKFKVVFFSEFNHCIYPWLSQINPEKYEVLMKNLDNLTCDNFLPNWPLSRLADLYWKIQQEAISRINCQSLSSSHYTITLVTNREQYDKVAEWI